jgi:serine/threonine protein kinase
LRVHRCLLTYRPTLLPAAPCCWPAGALLGFGSYGRVFQGRWHGKGVAIKIIHCQPEQLPRVLREAEIMLQLDHPNVRMCVPNKAALVSG